MNEIAKEIRSYFGISKMTDEECLMHVGKSKKDGAPGPGSGRYPLGSGDDPYQHDLDFLERIDSLKKKGWKETTENIKNDFGLSTSEYRKEKSLCRDDRRRALVAKAKQLRDQGMSNMAIGKEMGVPDTTVGYWFKKEVESRINKTQNTSDFLKGQVDKKKMIDVGAGVEKELNISRERLNTALKSLEDEGYHVYGGRIPQLTNPKQNTTLKILCSPEIEHKEIFDLKRIHSLIDYTSNNDGASFEKKFTYPASLDSKRLVINYAEDGGIKKDGVIELRRGVPDLSLGDAIYSQVRILVDGKRYLKGMAVYADDLPDGVDVRFNTNKSKDIPKMEVLKKIKSDPDNPFGSNIKDSELGGQYWYDDKTGKIWDPANPVGKKKLGLINKRSDQGDWSEWKDAIPSQFLSKQSKYMAKKQLDLAKANKDAEYDDIMSLTNPTIRKHYLEKFAEDCDAAAVELKAAALPGQKYHVILPVEEMGKNKVFAPRYENGTKLALIRYPHGGLFEIPVLTVDNKNKAAIKMMGSDAQDAIGIHHKVAEQLSGADFDGDTVMCIPTDDARGRVHINRQSPLKQLENFDNKLEYGPDRSKTTVDADGVEHYYRAGREYPIMRNTQKEMGVVSNLISDMTLRGASDDELARAVKHSMVVIDAEKHKLDWKQSYKDNNIDALKRKYQVKYDEKGNYAGYGGASTIISKAKGQETILKRKGQPRTNIKGKPWYDPNRPEGSLIYKNAPDEELYYVPSKYDKDTGIKTLRLENGKSLTYNYKNKNEAEKYDPVMKKDKDGNVYFESKNGEYKYRKEARTDKSKRMLETDDAYSLVSKDKYQMEIIYADYANSMKRLANKARLDIEKMPNLEYNKKAANIYKNEVESLDNKLTTAIKNKPRERFALIKANIEVQNKIKADDTLKPDDIKKLAQRAVVKYRQELDSVPRRKRSIEITDKEWEAIQSGAISNKKLKDILDNSDPDKLRERAMPKDKKQVSKAQITRMKMMQSSNFTLVEIANKMHLSPSVVSAYLKGAK